MRNFISPTGYKHFLNVFCSSLPYQDTAGLDSILPATCKMHVSNFFGLLIKFKISHLPLKVIFHDKLTTCYYLEIYLKVTKNQIVSKIRT